MVAGATAAAGEELGDISKEEKTTTRRIAKVAAGVGNKMLYRRHLGGSGQN
jgi:hypothetical protein